jgi:SOS-response transcriptional repressor LexA
MAWPAATRNPREVSANGLWNPGLPPRLFARRLKSDHNRVPIHLCVSAQPPMVRCIADHSYVVKKRNTPRPDMGKRLEAAMESSADCQTQTALANKAQVSQSTVGRLLKGLVNSQSDTLQKICSALGISSADLLDRPPAGGLGTDAAADARGSAAQADLVPLISWVQAGDFSESIDIHQPGYAEEWVKKPPKPCGPQTFALRVKGRSMEPVFQEGVVIYVDPGLAATNRDHIIMRSDDRNEVTFKRLVMEDGRSYLEPLNPAWPNKIIEIPEGARIVGVVIGA